MQIIRRGEPTDFKPGCPASPRPRKAAFGGVGRPPAAPTIMLICAETVRRIVGPGAVWPELTRQDIADEIFLEIEAGSSGKPNRAQDLANLERILSILIQIRASTRLGWAVRWFSASTSGSISFRPSSKGSAASWHRTPRRSPRPAPRKTTLSRRPRAGLRTRPRAREMSRSRRLVFCCLGYRVFGSLLGIVGGQMAI